MLEVSSWFVEQAKSPASKPVRQLLLTNLDGAQFDISHIVTKWPTFKRAIGKFMPRTMTLEYSTLELNRILEEEARLDSWQSQENWDPFGHRYEYRLGYLHPTSGFETYPLFTGRIRRRIKKDGVMTIKLEGVDSKITDQVIGSDETPIIIGGGTGPDARRPSEIVKDFLFLHIADGFDTTENETNTDLDYAEWLIWNSTFEIPPTGDPQWGTEMEAICTGQKMTSLIKEILKQTHSIGGLKGDGRVTFLRRNGLEAEGYFLDDVINADIIDDAKYEEDRFGRPTLVSGYIRAVGGEIGPRNAIANQTARAYYGTKEEVWQAGAIFHLGTSNLLGNMKQRTGEGHQLPTQVDITLPLFGMIYDVGDIVKVSNSASNPEVSSYWWNVMATSVNMERFEVKLRCEVRFQRYIINLNRETVNSTGVFHTGRLFKTLDDTSYTSIASGQYPAWDGSSYFGPVTPALTNLTDVPSGIKIIDTETTPQPDSYSWPGHFCFAMYREFRPSDFLTVNTGDLLSYWETVGREGLVLKRQSASRNPAGVALTSAESGDQVLMGLWGLMDIAVTSGEERGAVGDVFAATATESWYHTIDAFGGGFNIGHSAWRVGSSNYAPNFARMHLTFGEG